MNDIVRLPFYTRLASVLIAIIALCAILYVGNSIFVPVTLALLFAIMLRPICRFLTDKFRFPNIVASIISVSVLVLILTTIVTLVSWGISDFSKDWEVIQKNLTIHYNSIQDYIHDKVGINKNEQQKYISDATNGSMDSLKEMLGKTLLDFSDTIMNLILVPFYIFLFLLYRTHFITFLSKLVGPTNQEVLKDILYQVKTAVQSYLMGLIIQMFTVTALTTIGLMIAGVEYAFLLGAITGLLNLIPYLGILVACLISIFATLTGSPDLSLILWVIGVTVVVQLIDNNILVPLIVSSKVEINAFVSIIGIIIGGMIAGVSGMFLAIPVMAIMKVIFDRVRLLEPWGYLMGDDLPKTPQFTVGIFKNKNGKTIEIVNTGESNIPEMNSDQDKINFKE